MEITKIHLVTYLIWDPISGEEPFEDTGAFITEDVMEANKALNIWGEKIKLHYSGSGIRMIHHSIQEGTFDQAANKHFKEIRDLKEADISG